MTLSYLYAEIVNKWYPLEISFLIFNPPGAEGHADFHPIKNHVPSWREFDALRTEFLQFFFALKQPNTTDQPANSWKQEFSVLAIAAQQAHIVD